MHLLNENCYVWTDLIHSALESIPKVRPPTQTSKNTTCWHQHQLTLYFCLQAIHLCGLPLTKRSRILAVQAAGEWRNASGMGFFFHSLPPFHHGISWWFKGYPTTSAFLASCFLSAFIFIEMIHQSICAHFAMLSSPDLLPTLGKDIHLSKRYIMWNLKMILMQKFWQY